MDHKSITNTLKILSVVLKKDEEEQVEQRHEK
jgi:hypothetical protein